MCGIAGYIVKEPNHQTAVALALLAQCIEERGRQSWGMMTDRAVIKRVQTITAGFEMPSKLTTHVALHTRHATDGALTKRNAHPFEVRGAAGKIVGMHNGIIYNHRELNRDYARACEVDSEHIFEHLSEAISLSDIEGYGAIVYRKGSEWFIGKFNGGEMAIAVTAQGLYFASRDKYLSYALGMAGITIRRLLTLQDGKLYTITADGIEVTANLPIKESNFSYTWDSGFDWRKGLLEGGEDEAITVQDDEQDVVVSAGEISTDGIECDYCGERMTGKDRVYCPGGEDCDLCRGCYDAIKGVTQ
jgi:asparagine synthetase B (glutamine-hydrolysing)